MSSISGQFKVPVDEAGVAAFKRLEREAWRDAHDGSVLVGDCLELMRAMPDGCVDLVVCSPPYEAARTYDIGFNLKGEDWVAWAVERFTECLRVSRGLVAWVVEGQTKGYRYSGGPLLLYADLHRAGVNMRRPLIYRRNGISGSGGPDWFRCDHEYVICATPPGRLPWSDNTACGQPPKFAPGGEPSHRMPNGRRVNLKHTKTMRDGRKAVQGYVAPEIANPGTVIDCKAGGGNLGSRLAHDNEAPFPEALVERFVRSFCPPGGVVLDPFMGSGTTAAVAERHDRRWVGIDIRQNQADLTARRVAEVREQLAAAASTSEDQQEGHGDG